jgi:phosphoribosylformylglycinamidine synthase
MGTVTTEATLDLGTSKLDTKYRDIWFKTSFLLDQSKNGMAQARFDNYKTKH